MGAKTWMLVLADANARDALAAQPPLDREATRKLADTLFPGEKLEPIGNGDLSFSCPPDDEVHIYSKRSTFRFPILRKYCKKAGNYRTECP